MTGYLNKQPAALQLSTLIGFFIGFFLIYGAFMQLVFPAISGGYTLESLLTAVKKDSGLVNYLKLAQFLYTFIVFLVPGALFIYLTEPLAGVGLEKGPSIYNLIFAVLIMASALPVIGYLMEWNETWPMSDSLRQLEKEAEEQTKIMLSMPNIPSLLVNLLMVAVMPAIAEELFFRGAMQRVFTRMVKNGWVAVIITSIIFSAIHMQFLGFVPRFALSVLLGGIYLLSGNLWLAIIAHFLNNALSVVLFYVGQGEADESLPWYINILSGVVVLALLFMMRRNNRSIATIKQQDYGERLG
ncbi:CPBP family intramembrane glutamic endopeptidase [uncultured Chitinophaga sp.]|uniref:CPBP family intramembrane glutamic endopeptidase n=1 Tax=uncultured Chitinophaga sp. TaxID=339340 RepID=UPI0025F9FC0B|nr:CPBP family intramembrane glutamic endopeptidase [uncultured Chitinophaga sp.]